MNQKQQVIDTIHFADPQMAHVSHVLRYAAGSHMDVSRDVFIEACVEAGYKASTAKTCYYHGRAAMQEMAKSDD